MRLAPSSSTSLGTTLAADPKLLFSRVRVQSAGSLPSPSDEPGTARGGGTLARDVGVGFGLGALERADGARGTVVIVHAAVGGAVGFAPAPSAAMAGRCSRGTSCAAAFFCAGAPWTAHT